MVDTYVLTAAAMPAANSGVDLLIPLEVISESKVNDIFTFGFVHVVESVAG